MCLSLSSYTRTLGFSGWRCQYYIRRRRTVNAAFSAADDGGQENDFDENIEQNANTVFAKLLQTQLEIVVSATNAISAALFVDAGSDTAQNGSSMLMVCCYPPMYEQDDDFDISLAEQLINGESRYTVPSPYRQRIGSGESSSVITLGILQTLSPSKPLQLHSSESSYNDRVCSSVARSLGVSIVMEMVTHCFIVTPSEL